MGSSHHPQIIQLGIKYPYLLTHFAGLFVSLVSFYFIYFFYRVCMHVCVMGLCRERSEDIVEPVLSFLLYVESENGAQVIRPARQVFYQCGHIGSP